MLTTGPVSPEPRLVIHSHSIQRTQRPQAPQALLISRAARSSPPSHTQGSLCTSSRRRCLPASAAAAARQHLQVNLCCQQISCSGTACGTCQKQPQRMPGCGSWILASCTPCPSITWSQGGATSQQAETRCWICSHADDHTTSSVPITTCGSSTASGAISTTTHHMHA